MNKYGEQEPFLYHRSATFSIDITQIHKQTKKSIIFILVIKAKNPFATFKQYPRGLGDL